jgi:hypothetical protein
MRLRSLVTSATIWPIVPAQDDEWLAWGYQWNKNWQEVPKHLKESSPGLLFPPQIWKGLTRARTRSVAVGSRQLTAWATAGPSLLFLLAYNTRAITYVKYHETAKIEIVTSPVVLTGIQYKRYYLCEISPNSQNWDCSGLKTNGEEFFIYVRYQVSDSDNICSSWSATRRSSCSQKPSRRSVAFGGRCMSPRIGKAREMSP